MYHKTCSMGFPTPSKFEWNSINNQKSLSVKFVINKRCMIHFVVRQFKTLCSLSPFLNILQSHCTVHQEQQQCSKSSYFKKMATAVTNLWVQIHILIHLRCKHLLSSLGDPDFPFFFKIVKSHNWKKNYHLDWKC